jgi:hypothetical protein
MVPVGFGYPLDLSHQESQHKPLGDLSAQEIIKELKVMEINAKYKDDLQAKKLYKEVIEASCKLLQEINNIFKNLHKGSFVVALNKLDDLTFKNLKDINGDKKNNIKYSLNPTKNTVAEDNLFYFFLDVYTKAKMKYNNHIKEYWIFSKDDNNLTFLDIEKDQKKLHILIYSFFVNFCNFLELPSTISTVKDLFNLPYDFVEDKYIVNPLKVKPEDKDLINQISHAPKKIIDKFPQIPSQATPEEKIKTQEAIKKILAEYKQEVKSAEKTPKENPLLQYKPSSDQNPGHSNSDNNIISSMVSSIGYVLGGVTIIVVPLTLTGAIIYVVKPKSKFFIFFKTKIKKFYK